MKVTYQEVLAAHAAVQKLAENRSAEVPPFVPPLVALRLARIARRLSEEAQAFEAGRIALINKYAVGPDEQGQQIVPPRNAVEFRAQLAELAAEEVDLDVQTLKLADFGETPLPITALCGMDWLIDAP